MKSTFFGLTSFAKSRNVLAQSETLVQNTSFPVILGFEFYPVVVFPKSQIPENLEILKNRGFEIYPAETAQRVRVHSPGQLVIYPLVPCENLKITEADLLRVFTDTTRSWLRSIHVQTEAPLVHIMSSEISINISNDPHLASQVKGYEPPLKSSLQEQGIQLDLRAAFEGWVNHFTAHLLQAIPAQGQSQ